jgi:hypothetical protein
MILVIVIAMVLNNIIKSALKRRNKAEGAIWKK